MKLQKPKDHKQYAVSNILRVHIRQNKQAPMITIKTTTDSEYKQILIYIK